MMRMEISGLDYRNGKFLVEVKNDCIIPENQKNLVTHGPSYQAVIYTLI